MCERRIVARVVMFACLIAFGAQLHAAPDVAATAGKLDQILAAENYGAESPGEVSQSAPIVDDATFLRRVSLDIVGELPSADDLSRFVLDPATDKRKRRVDQLLADPRFGVNWGRYWRDVIYYRRSDERTLQAAKPTADYLAAQLNQNTPWSEIAKAFITATGDVSENGACGVIYAQMADPSNVTAEVSRIFMGVQIQCAQCHNHPFDRWKREQFHEMAAFFPRIGVRPIKGQQGPKAFEVVSFNRPMKKRSPADTEGVKLEHFMPDLENPEAEGTPMKPIFFATGGKLEPGASDLERRAKLAEYVTSRGNHWFAKAFVNRAWGELIGHGFQEPLDDLGPDRVPMAPKTFDYLSREFASSGYDVKWLFRVIASSNAYQRASQPRGAGDAIQFASTCTQRLRGDQLFSALASALGVDPEAMMNNPKGKGAKGKKPELGGPRGRMNQVFGYDPSDPRDEVASSIPQALMLMNGPQINRAMTARGPTALARLLEQERDDRVVVGELYLRTLAREPSKAEVTRCLSHVQEAAGRVAAFEDIQWALINSTEFLYRK